MHPAKITVPGRYRKRRLVLRIDGPIANIRLEIQSRLSTRHNRAIVLSFLRDLKPWFRYFKTASTDLKRHRRDRSRRVQIFDASRFSTPEGHLGFEIRMQRLDYGLTQRQLAEKAGIAASQLSELERGRCKARDRTLLAITRALESSKPENLHGSDRSTTDLPAPLLPRP
jgi:DNA-binding XRE family transcriptional regulator